MKRARHQGGQPPGDPAVPDYNRSARTDFRIWGVFIVGVIFAWTGLVVDPATNCNDSGECAPWLVPVAMWMGLLFAAAGLGQLLVNPRRGSRIDPASGDLIWWQKRLGVSAGDAGRIHPSRIQRIRIVRESEREDQVHLYDVDGVRQHYFDAEVIPWPHDKWAMRLAGRWPHIQVEISG